MSRTQWAAAAAILLLAAGGAAAAADSAPTAARVMCYNIRNYFVEGEAPNPPFKDQESKEALVRMVSDAKPDILFLLEVGGPRALADFKEALRAAGMDYPFSTSMFGDDDTRGIGLLSRETPAAVEKRNDLRYSIRPKERMEEIDSLGVQRGFMHAVFRWDAYKLHVVAAHLKSRMPHPRFNPADMRRAEARLLRKLAEGLLEVDPGANILLMGDMNDDYSSSPIGALRRGEAKNSPPFYDLRPLDSEGGCWTHWWDEQDIYGRIDYALASEGLLPELDWDGVRVVGRPHYWSVASDHRPVMVSVRPREETLWGHEKVRSVFSDSLVRGLASAEPAGR